MKPSKVERIVTITWIASLILAISTAVMGWELPSHIFSVASWIALAAVIGVGVFNCKKTQHGKDTSKS